MKLGLGSLSAGFPGDLRCLSISRLLSPPLIILIIALLPTKTAWPAG